MKYLTLMMFFVYLGCAAQVWEDFSDGELENDPAWMGDLEKFRISSSSAVPAMMRPALQLYSEGEGTAYLAAPQSSYPSRQWEFWIKLSFNSSSSNYARIYLAADAIEPDSVRNGCFIQVGGPNDSVWMGRKGPEGETVLTNMPVLYTGNSTNVLRMKVIRENEGVWHFFAHPSGGTPLAEIAGLEDDSPIPGIYFILYCKHTASNATKFYFDDLYSGPRIIDSVPPLVTGIKVPSPGGVQVIFDEPVEEVSASSTSHYLLSEGMGHPYDAFPMLDPSNVMLFFEKELLTGHSYELYIEGVKDLTGNTMLPDTVPVSYYRTKPYDVIVNEVMADPAPAVLLPDYEYIELFNRTEHRLDLEGWTLQVASNSYAISEGMIDPKGYLLLMAEEALLSFQFCGPAVGFSSFSISNDGASLSLADTSGRIICHSGYDPERFTDDNKSEGGWSLERTDPAYPCDDETTWMGSVDPTGGTPGRENSRLAPADQAVRITAVCCPADTLAMVSFNHALDPVTLADIHLYSADNGLALPHMAVPSDDGRNVSLYFWQHIMPGTRYRLEVSPPMKDCLEQPIGTAMTADFALPEPGMPFDIIFNEVLFHPLNDGAEYIELFNRSEKTLRLDDLILAYIREVPPNPPDTEKYEIAIGCLAILPGEFKVLTKQPEKVLYIHPEAPATAMLRTDPFPSLNNDAGRLLLLDRDGNTIDGLDYAETMHFPLLNSFTGVALERIYPDVPGTGPGNWLSASSVSGYGTPGYTNSQHQDPVEHEDVLEIFPPVFSPDGDGKDDILGIHWRSEEAGMTLRIYIFSEDGRIVRRLVENTLAGSQNSFSWDGSTDDRYAAPSGIYIILVEAVSMNGYSRKYKKAAALR